MTQEEPTQFEMMAETITSISTSTDDFQILQLAKRFIRNFTFGAEHTRQDHGMIGVFMLRADSLDESKRISVSNWTPDFVAERAKLNGYTHDPSVIMVQQANKPFTWAQGMAGADKASMAITDLCEQHTGQRDGLTFPIADIHMLKGAATIGLDLSPNDFSPNQIGMMHHVFIAAYACLYRRLGPFPEDIEAVYSPRQRELVQLIARGFNVPAIAILWGTSESNVRMQARRAMEKVGAKTQAQLVAKSVNKIPLQ